MPNVRERTKLMIFSSLISDILQKLWIGFYRNDGPMRHCLVCLCIDSYSILLSIIYITQMSNTQAYLISHSHFTLPLIFFGKSCITTILRVFFHL